jgi:hypothetical protein
MKLNSVCWRGGLTGTFYEAGNFRARGPDFIFKNVREDSRISYLRYMSRYALVEKYFDNPQFDVGFALSGDQMQFFEYPEIRKYVRSHLSKHDIIAHKYVLALAGHDYATSLYWMLSSNSVVLKEEYEWETFVDCHVKPWEHYIPIESTLCDLEEKLAWCDSHQDECIEITRKAHELCARLGDEKLRATVLAEVIRRYEEGLII